MTGNEANSEARSGPSKSSWSWAALLGLGWTACFLSTLSSANSYDSVAYALDIERTLATGYAGTLLHEYHVAWNLLGLALAWLLPPLRSAPLLAFQVLNAIAGGALVGLVALWLHAKTGRPVLAAGASLMAVNVAYWHHATDGEPYAVASLLLFAALALAPCEPGLVRPGRRIVAAALAMGAAVAVHLASVVVAPVLALGLLLAAPRRRGAVRATCFLALAAGTSLPLYLVKWTALEHVGIVQGVRNLLEGVLRPAWPLEDYFLSSAWSPGTELATIGESFAPTAPALRWLALGLLGLGAFGAVAGWRRGLRAPALAFGVFLAEWCFFATYNLGSFKFVVAQICFLVPAALLGWRELERLRPVLARAEVLWPALALALAALNFSGHVAPELDPTNNRELCIARAIGAATVPEDAVLFTGLGGSNLLKVYVPYFARREALILDFLGDGKKIGPDELRRRLLFRLQRVSGRGGTVHALPEVLADSPERRRYLERHVLEPDWFDTALPPPRSRPSARLEGEALLYPLVPVVAAP